MRHTFFAPNDYRLYLQHYGVKGMKWGVRKDRSKSRIYRRNYRKANAIYDTLTDDEKYYVTAERGSKRYANPGEYGRKGTNVYSYIEQHNGTPVSVLDMWSNKRDGGLDISIAVRNDKRYRRKGYGNRAVQRGIQWFKSHPEYQYMVWGVNKKNDASIKLAERNGFKLYNPDHDENWATYLYEREPY